MKFKIDENLPAEVADVLRAAEHDATTATQQGLSGASDPQVVQACKAEDRILVTLDLDFCDVRAYPPGRYPGFMVLRLQRLDKILVLRVFERAIRLLKTNRLEHCLWIIEEDRVRIRSGEQE